MGNKLTVFNNPAFGNVRVIMVENEPWFVGKDIASVLGYSNTRDALNKRVDEEDKGVANCDSLGGSQKMVVINESGLYSLILSSKLPNAKQFKHWVTAEVLPSIRKSGMYMTDNTIDNILNDPDSFIELLQQYSKTKKELHKVEAELVEARPKVDFCENHVEKGFNICLQQCGKELGKRPNKFIEKLANDGYLFKRNVKGAWLPYEQYGDNGKQYFTVRQTSVEGYFQTLVTPKGKQHFAELYKGISF